MNKEFVLNTIRECDSWKEGQCVMLRHTTFCGSEWELIFRREENIYSPYKFSVSGKKIGTHERFSRRYIDAESAFLHIMNNFNENANVKDRFNTLESALDKLE